MFNVPLNILWDQQTKLSLERYNRYINLWFQNGRVAGSPRVIQICRNTCDMTRKFKMSFTISFEMKY